MTFERWLLKQIKRNDPIGDLARDFKRAKGLREKCDEKHLSKWNAIPEAYETLEEAKKEYSKQILGTYEVTQIGDQSKPFILTRINK